MGLDKRKRQVLYAIVHDYIQTAEPVGSRTISRRYELGVSPATIRNEMSDLEEMGYLEQPYTSAGRIPSDLGYRFYVDSLLQIPSLTQQEVELMKRVLSLRMRSAEEIVQQLAKLLSALTSYTAIVLGPSESQVRLRQIQLVPISSRQIYLVGVTDGGLLLNRMIEVPGGVAAESLAYLQQWLNQRLAGLTLEQIKTRSLADLQHDMQISIDLFETVVDELLGIANRPQVGKVYLGGTTNILNQPEFHDLHKVRTILELLEEDTLVWKAIAQVAGKGVSVSIGTENPLSAMHDCSLITAEYRLGDGLVGHFGLLGPTRMNYDRVLALVQGVCDTLNQLYGM